MNEGYEWITRKIQIVDGWNLSEVLDLAKEWGANPQFCALESHDIIPGVKGVALVEYRKVAQGG